MRSVKPVEEQEIQGRADEAARVVVLRQGRYESAARSESMTVRERQDRRDRYSGDEHEEPGLACRASGGRARRKHRVAAAPETRTGDDEPVERLFFASILDECLGRILLDRTDERRSRSRSTARVAVGEPTGDGPRRPPCSRIVGSSWGRGSTEGRKTVVSEIQFAEIAFIAVGEKKEKKKGLH